MSRRVVGLLLGLLCVAAVGPMASAQTAPAAPAPLPPSPTIPPPLPAREAVLESRLRKMEEMNAKMAE